MDLSTRLTIFNETVIIFVLSMAMFFTTWPLIWLEFDTHHEGLLLAAGQAIQLGANPFTLFSQYGPLYNMLPIASSALGFESFVALRWLAAFSYVASVGLVWAMGRPIGASWAVIPWTALAVLLFPFGQSQVMLVWPSVFLMTTSLGILAALSHWIVRKNRVCGLLGGVLAVLAILIKVNIGALLVITILVFALCAWFLNRQARYLLAPVIGILGAVFFLSVVLVATNSFELYWFHQVGLASFMAPYIPEVWYDRPASVDFILETLFPGMPEKLTFWTSVVLLNLGVFLGSLGYYLFLRRTLLGLFAVMVSSVSIASWAQFYPVSEELHHFWAGLPILASLMVIFAALLGRVNLLARVALLRSVAPVGALCAALFLLVYGVFALSQLPGDTVRPLQSTNPALRHLLFSNDRAELFEAHLDALIIEDPHERGLDLLNLTPDAWMSAPRPVDRNVLIVPAHFSLYDDARPETSAQIYSILNYGAELDAVENDLRVVSMGYAYYQPVWSAMHHFPNGRLLLRAAEIPTLPSVFREAEEAACREILLGVQLASSEYFKDDQRFWGILLPGVPLDDAVEINVLVSRRTVEGPNATILSNIGMGKRTGYRGFALQKLPNRGENFFLVEYTEDGEPLPLLSFELRPEMMDHINLRFVNGTWSGMLNGVFVGEATSRHSNLAGANTLRFNTGRAFASYFVGEVLDFRIDDLTGCINVLSPFALNQSVAYQLFNLADR